MYRSPSSSQDEKYRRMCVQEVVAAASTLKEEEAEVVTMLAAHTRSTIRRALPPTQSTRTVTHIVALSTDTMTVQAPVASRVANLALAVVTRSTPEAVEEALAATTMATASEEGPRTNREHIKTRSLKIGRAHV